MPTKYTTGGGRASVERAVKLVRGEIAEGFDFFIGIGAIPKALGTCVFTSARKAVGDFVPRVIDEIIGSEVPQVVTEIAPDTTIQASEVVASALANQATGRRI